MPEGPEIRRATDRIERVLQGRPASRVHFAFPRLQRYERRLCGRRVVAIETRGKALLLHFANRLSIYSHSQLYGRWYVTPAGRLPATRRSLRLAVHTARHSALLYSASEIEVLSTSRLDDHPFLAKLGLDPLQRRVSEKMLSEHVAESRFERRRLSLLLLDQSFVAGIGNYLRSEALFVAGLHPERRPAELDAGERRALVRALLRVPRRAYRTGGITNDPKRAAALRRRGLRRSAYRHYVFGREGEGCFDCGATVRRAVLGGRNLFFCPRCQTRRSA
jgi:endonuclease-8